MVSVIPEDLIRVLLKIGEAMMDSGAEVWRVEDTLTRIGTAYGVAHMNVFVITSSIVITMEMADGSQITRMCRMRHLSAIDLTKLEQLNALSRAVCGTPVSLDILEERTIAISRGHVSRYGLLVGCILAASSFAVFFGGTAGDAVFAACVGVLVWILQLRVAPVCMNAVVSQGVLSFLTGFAVAFGSRILPFVHQDTVMMGVIMLLIPGVAFTNSLRDIILGDTLSGILRMIEALLLAVTLAVGVIAAIWLSTRCFV